MAGGAVKKDSKVKWHGLLALSTARKNTVVDQAVQERAIFGHGPSAVVNLPKSRYRLCEQLFSKAPGMQLPYALCVSPAYPIHAPWKVPRRARRVRLRRRLGVGNEARRRCLAAGIGKLGRLNALARV
jgi:hypothetical protein